MDNTFVLVTSDHGYNLGNHMLATAKMQVRKTAHLFFEFSLCLSRACIGKMIVFIYKWLKNAVFRCRPSTTRCVYP